MFWGLLAVLALSLLTTAFLAWRLEVSLRSAHQQSASVLLDAAKLCASRTVKEFELSRDQQVERDVRVTTLTEALEDERRKAVSQESVVPKPNFYTLGNGEVIDLNNFDFMGPGTFPPKSARSQ